MSGRVARRLAGALLLTATALAAGAAPSARIRVKGSDTMLLLARRWAEAFMATHPGVAVEVDGGGTATGIRALIAGDADVAAASRPLRPEESQQLAERHGTLGYSVLTARDALSVYVHPDNPVTDLSTASLRAVFTGAVRRWSELGGRGGEIVVLNRNPSSGTRLFFAEHVLGGEDYTRRDRVLATTAAIVEAVRQDPDAIGYGGIGVAEGVRLCTIDGVAPSAEHVRDGTYPIARYLYLYTAVPPRGAVKDFIDWVLGSEGQAVVAEVGYVALHGVAEVP